MARLTDTEKIVHLKKIDDEGLSIPEYAKKYGISQGSLYYWKNKFSNSISEIEDMEDEGNEVIEEEKNILIEKIDTVPEVIEEVPEPVIEESNTEPEKRPVIKFNNMMFFIPVIGIGIGLLFIFSNKRGEKNNVRKYDSQRESFKSTSGISGGGYQYRTLSEL